MADIKDRLKKKQEELGKWKAQLDKLNKARLLVIDMMSRTEGAIEELKALDEDKTEEK